MADLIDRAALLTANMFGNSASIIHRMYADELIKAAPAVDAVMVGDCDGCYWKEIGRRQRCNCCRRNPDMKDGYYRRNDP